MLEDQPRTYVSITRFPDGDVKVSGCHQPRPSSRSKPRKKLEPIELQQKAARRAGTAVQDKAKFFQLGYLLTLTYRGPIFDRMRVQRDFNRFKRLVCAKLPEFFCLAVLEFHKGGGANDGGIHLHLGCDRFYPVEFLRACWWRCVGDRQGNIQIEHRSHRDSPRRVGSYLAKYVTKDFDSLPREFGQHRYLQSKAVKVPREKMVFFKGYYREHLATARVLCVFNSKSPLVTEWQSDDGWQFVFKTYS